MRLRAPIAATFASLENPNYRRYFFGQALSLIGTWMQMVAQSWLVLTMTGSAVAVGVVVALQTAPSCCSRRTAASSQTGPTSGSC